MPKADKLFMDLANQCPCELSFRNKAEFDRNLAKPIAVFL